MENNSNRLLIGIGIAFALIVGLIGVVCLFVSYIYPNYLAAPTPADLALINTQAAETVSALITQTEAVKVTSPPPPETLPPTDGSAPTLTSTPTSTATPTQIPPTATPPPPTPTPTPIPCDWAQFIDDVTVEDGTVFPPNAMFTKTWRLKNIGSCSWTKDYKLVFDRGARMGGPQAIQIGKIVDPGESVNLSVDLVAPVEPGDYRGYWKLSTPGGQEFGIGVNADNSFWVEIELLNADKYVYDFALNYCLAQWSSGAGKLPCPGEPGETAGFTLLVNNPVVEIGRRENEPALWTVPEQIEDGLIHGEYPEFKVEKGYRFRAIIGCLDEAEKCDVIFQLNYRAGDQDYKTLYQFREVYDGKISSIDLDLSPLVGQEVKFILTILANGSPADDSAFWLLPRIEEIKSDGENYRRKPIIEFAPQTPQ
jgi:hypothetical protein